MPQCKHLQNKHPWEEYNQYTSSDQSEPLLLKAIVVIWREYLISSKEKACLDVNWCLWDQPLMKGLCPSIGQTLEWLNSTACSHQCPCPDPIISKNVNNDEKAMLSWSYQRNQPIISRTPMWNESKHLRGTAIPKKPSSTERGMPLCKVHQMKCANHVSCSNVKKNDIWYPPRNGHGSKIHHRLRRVCLGIIVIL